MNIQDGFIYVIFGASGDLAKRKLIPAIYSLYINGFISEKFILLGVSRTAFTDESFRKKAKTSLLEFNETNNSERIDEFTNKLYYQPLVYDELQSYQKLKFRLEELRAKKNLPENIIYYLSTPPDLYGVIPENIAAVDLHNPKRGAKRLIIEKPFGYDLESALALKERLLKVWKEDQLFRIDHYLGKETVQNLLVTRFSNGIFEPLWNSNYIDHIEITSSESIGVEQRGGYYNNSGALRDMVQNHLLQVAALIAMEPPANLAPNAIRNEILKVFQSLGPIKEEDVGNVTIRGQYTASTIKKEKALGYREEKDVPQKSLTETFAAIKFYINNWRWGGVPFYIRTGKRLPTRVTEVVVHFKSTPHFLFANKTNTNSNNQLVLRIQPDEGMLLKFGMKVPGAGFEVQNVNMDFHYSDLTNQRIPSAYERLIYDSIKGDSTLFARTEEIIEAWKFVTPILNAWENNCSIPLYGYPAGSWGPEKSDKLIEGDQVTWRYPCKNLSNDGIYCEL